MKNPVCPSCGSAVFGVTLVDSAMRGGLGLARRVIVAASPDRFGTGMIAAYRDVAGTWHARILEDWEAPKMHERRHREHPPACPAVTAARAARPLANRAAR